MKIAMGVEYDGSGFAGWQLQRSGLRTIQGCLEEALAKIADGAIRVHGAGRTDTGVHATGQVIHIETSVERETKSWLFGGNRYLPHDIAIQWVQPVPDDFHARFSAIRRSYRYLILNRPARSALYGSRITWECRALNVERMQQAAICLLGEHDFSAFRAQECQAKSPIRTIYRLEVVRQGDLITLEVEANAFLHHMVRNIAGVLMTIGRGEAEPAWSEQVLAGRNRALGGVTAAPHGLYLIAVDYPEKYRLKNVSPGRLPATERYVQLF
jgi:tRNA pseudouridine38-40 synthase